MAWFGLVWFGLKGLKSSNDWPPAHGQHCEQVPLVSSSADFGEPMGFIVCKARCQALGQQPTI